MCVFLFVCRHKWKDIHLPTNFPCQIVLIIKDWFQLLYNKGSPGLCSVMGEMEGVREAQKEGYICISIADSHCCIAENNTTL